MSDETEQRMCDEDFGSDEEGEEGDVESYLEDNSSELMDRLRELEAENSALVLANESQREAYERCLDEVANHVVQALLNQKDLREECIKLKMLVFDLERQNRALCELFQQKLPNHPTAHYQVTNSHPCSPDELSCLALSVNCILMVICVCPQGNGYRTQHASPGPRGPAANMEALSPFFKKKAHILEVLRKMEETDPLKFHPSTTSLSPESPPKPCNHVCSPSKATQSHIVPAAAMSECHSKTRAGESKQSTKNEANQQPAGAAAHSSIAEAASQNLEGEEDNSELNASASEELTGFCATSHLDGVPNGLALSFGDEPSAVPEKDGTDPEASCVRASASVSPSPSCLSDVKAAAINSPSKLLKFLKIPSMGEKSQAPTSSVRLSPQLTRNSRIPCRTNNYEVYHSPVPTRRATTTERCRQPPPPPARSDSLSAPKPTVGSKIGAPSSSPKVSQRVPHYENVCDMSIGSKEEEPTQAQSKTNYSQTREKQDGHTREVNIASSEVTQGPPAPPTRRSDSSSIPKRPTVGAARSQADSSHHAFKDRLAALGKLRSSEDLQGGLRPTDAVNEDSSDGNKMGLPSPNTDAPQVLRNNIKCPGSLNLAYNVKASIAPHSSNSPNKIPPKSPSKPCQGPSVHRGGKSAEAPRYSSKSEERTKISGKGKKNPMYGDSLPPPPPRPPASEVEKPSLPVPTLQSAIEQKVMKGIEENVLKLQEQDRGGQGGEVKQKASNGIASWFGLKKSKLPALSRKTDGTKAKEEKKEWKINIPSVGRDSVKMASRCKEGVEGLNISTLMEKAEGLRRALEEERAYVERSGRGHSCEVVMDQAQGQLAVMYRGFINSHLLNLPPPCFSSAGSGASTYTLDSGIGTFPLPDCSSGVAARGLSKTKGGAEHHSGGGSPGRAGRRARTLDRELTSQEDCYAPHKQLIPTIQYGSVLEGRGSAGVIREGVNTPLPVPAQSGMSRRGKTRTPSVPEMSREAGLELLRERPEEALSPSRPQVLETPESLSDSLYDSLSSCGSQG
uniref:NCK-associated protein 5-like n=1 Tax=Maylandia zebra TaxID=106582 RepID=A0A3P9DUW4_9CICH